MFNPTLKQLKQRTMIPQYESTGEWVQRIEEQKRSEPSKKRKPLSHTEIIKCPECSKIQSANVKHTQPFYSYVHECIKCKYIIMESEWVTIKPKKKGGL